METNESPSCSISTFSLEHAMNCLAQGIRIIDVDYVVGFVNSAFEALSGIKRRDAEGKRCWEVFPSPLCNTPECRMARIRQGEKAIQTEVEGLKKTGEKTSFIVSTFPLYSPEKKLMGMIESFIDITEARNLKARAEEVENRYKAIVELTGELGEGVFVTQDVENKEGLIVFASRQCTNITGYSNTELRSMLFFDLLAPEHRQNSKKRHRQKLNGEPLPGLYEVSVIRKDGRKIPAELTSALTLYNNKPANVVYLREITQRKEMEARVISERNMARNYLEVANVLIIAIDREHKVSLINRKGCKLLGYPPEKIIGLKWCDNFLPFRYRETITTLFDGLFRGDTKHYEYFENPVLTSTGEERVVAWHNAIVLDKDNNISGVLCSGNDITELRQAETELYEYHHHLEEIIKERTTQLEEQVLQRSKAEERLIKTLEEESKLRQNLEKQIQQNAEFMRMIAHEMKTPLTSLLASSDLLVENYMTEAAGKLVKQVNKGALDLEKRVNDLFDLARGEIGMLQLSRKEINPVKILAGTYEYFKALSENQGITLTANWPEALPVIFGDHRRVTQVLNNILDNALKYTEPGGTIILTAKVTEDVLLIQVEDSGCGIPDNRLLDIFKPYYRVSTNLKVKSGMGMGLALSQIFVELHGGRIWAESKEGSGSQISFTLPLTKEGDFYEISDR